MADSSRIEQFRKMAEADPDNVLGHYSLGQEYLNSARYAEAQASFERALQLDPNLSKAYQLLAAALFKQGQKEAGISRLNQGIKIAAQRGDMLPKNAMIAMLKELGAPLPPEASAGAQQEQPVGADQVRCARCNQVRPKLPKAPFRNAQGQIIFEKICAPCWREWIGMGTKVINELRLPLNDPQAQKIYDQHMLEFLNLK